MSANIQSQVFYEIALSIGNSSNLDKMLREFLPALVRKLTCRVGVIYRYDDKNNWVPCATVPRRVKGLVALAEAEKHLFSNGPVPAVLHWEGQEIYINAIPSFGAVVLIKSGQPLVETIRFSLPQLYEKLGHACQSCIQAETIKKSEALYRALVNTSRDAILMTDLDGTITFASPTACDVYGWSITDLEGIAFEQSLSVTIDKKTLSLGYEKMCLGESGSLPPYRILGKNKEVRWLDHSWSVVVNEDGTGRIIHFVRDITEKLNKELQHTAMLKVVPAAIYYRRLNRAGEAFFISDQVRTILGYGPEEVINAPHFLERLPPP